MTPYINLIRHEYRDGRYELTAQLPMWAPLMMNELAGPLIDELGGRPGLGYTALFDWCHYERVKAYFEDLGHETRFIDDRERGRKLRELLEEAE